MCPFSLAGIFTANFRLKFPNLIAQEEIFKAFETIFVVFMQNIQ